MMSPVMRNQLLATVLTLGTTLSACATPGYDPIVEGEVTLPAGVSVRASSILTVSMWAPAAPPSKLAEVQRPATQGMTFKFDLASGEAIVNAHLDLTGNGFSADDLVSDDIEVAQGDLHVMIELRAASSGR
jgi:hypothetical protein